MPLNIYSTIQSKYWGVGLFKYYTFNQLPNFILAAPVLTVAAASVAASVRGSTVDANLPVVLTSLLRFPIQHSESQRRVTAYAAHLSLMLLICLTALHVQVSTRFLSASPLLYWHMAELILKDLSPLSHQSSTSPASAGWTTQLLIVWLLVFNLVGTTLYSTFLPWT